MTGGNAVVYLSWVQRHETPRPMCNSRIGSKTLLSAPQFIG
jgi:hypothetical protein